jgi:FkbM family methyltransferase
MIRNTEAHYDEIQRDYTNRSLHHSPRSMSPAEFRGLYGEVVGFDCYGLTKLGFVPNVIFDIGANVGVFTRFARELFPKTSIIAVEPNEINFRNLNDLTSDCGDITFINKALGSGRMWTAGIPAGTNGSGCVFESAEFLGWGEDRYLSDEWTVPDIEPVTFAALAESYCRDGASHLVKVDCEGAELCLFSDPKSMRALATIDYIAIEIHGYAVGGHVDRMHATTDAAIRDLSTTHIVTMNEQTRILIAQLRGRHGN